ncbi:MAG: Ig-like domain-containing protein [Comamonadaceae bacterium]|nr:Ig-like domain-containing protein [Comamonadaceae bacterium]
MNQFKRLFTAVRAWAQRLPSPGGAATLAFCALLAAPGIGQAGDAAQLSVAEGVVVKFGVGAGLHVRDRLFTAPNVTFTSQADDATGGQLGNSAGQPQRGDWLGIIVAPGVAASGLKLDGLSLRYAGGTAGLPGHLNGGAALSVPGGDYRFSKLQLLDSTVGVRVVGKGAPVFSQSRLAGNATGLLAEQGATPSIGETDISGNSDFGVRNLDPATMVNARGNWWGHASGPRDAVGNPGGQGDPVSPGVDYGQFLAAEPLLTCTAVPLEGYVTRVRAIQLQLHCPQAAQYRIAEQAGFTTEAWLDMAGTPTTASFTLSAPPGEKMLHVQFRTAQGSMATVALAQPMAYAPNGPLVQFEQPAAGAVLADDTLIAVSATDPEGVREVELLVNGQRLALLTAPPYQATWALAAVRNGSHTLTARATNTQGLANTVSRAVTVQRAGGATAPRFALSFGGQPLQANASITQPGILAITAESPVGIARIQGSINGAEFFNQRYPNASPVTASQFLDFAQLPNGSHALGVVVTDGNGEQATLNLPFSLNLSAPAAPVITAPASGTRVHVPQLGVAGTAAPGACRFT